MIKRIIKSTAFAVVVAFSLGIGTDAAIRHRHPIKHTGFATLIDRSSNTMYFQRPNKELFVMTFDGPPAIYPNKLTYDISYQDVNSNLQHFVKAQY